jgi:ankyrin repeat protein
VLLVIGAIAVGLVAVMIVIVVVAMRDLDLGFGDGCESDDPMIKAATHGNRQEVARQLREGTNPDQEIDGATALQCAAGAARVETVRLLLDRDAHPTGATLMAAVGLQSGGLAIPIPDTDRTATADEQRVVGLLLDHGVDPDAGTKGPSPLLYAAWSGQAPIADLLLDRGADPDHGGRVDSYLITAAQLGFDSIVINTTTTASTNTTPRRGGDRQLPLPRGATVANVPPLVGAAWTGHVDIARRLLAAGADPNLASDDAFTPLLAAAARGDRPMVELLLAHGAKASPPVRAGVVTPAEAAKATGHPDIAALLEPA